MATLLFVRACGIAMSARLYTSRALSLWSTFADSDLRKNEYEFHMRTTVKRDRENGVESSSIRRNYSRITNISFWEYCITNIYNKCKKRENVPIVLKLARYISSVSHIKKLI